MKYVKLLVSLLCLICVFGADVATVHARLLDDWEIGIRKFTPPKEKERKRLAYVTQLMEAMHYALGTWVNTKTNYDIEIDDKYWANLEYTFIRSHNVYNQPNRLIFDIYLEKEKAIVEFDRRNPNEFTIVRPDRSSIEKYKRKQ